MGFLTILSQFLGDLQHAGRDIGRTFALVWQKGMQHQRSLCVSAETLKQPIICMKHKNFGKGIAMQNTPL